MNFMPETIDSKTYIGPLVPEFQQPISDDFQKTTSFVEDSCDSLAGFGTGNSPSATTDFKRSDTCFEDLDANVETSVPESDFIPEYFDIYGQNEPFNKVYSTFITKPKWEEECLVSQDDQNEALDTTTTTTATSDPGFKVMPFNSNTLFFEDDFRYVTSKIPNHPRNQNSSSDFWDKNDSSSMPTSNYLLQPTYKPESGKDLYTLPQSMKDDLMDKAELASTSFAQITNTMANLNSNGSNNVSMVTNNLVNQNMIDNSINCNFYPNNLVSNMGPFFLNSHEVKRPLFLNTPVFNTGLLLDSDLYLFPTLTNKFYNLISNYQIGSNYCVYVGADYNKLVCTCNVVRPNGSNSHSVNCNVVAAGVELSTESWPVCKASQMYSLINRWDRILKKYRKLQSSTEYSFYLPDDYKPPVYVGPDEDKNLKTNLSSNLPNLNPEHMKNANSLISEITGIKLNADNTDQFSLRNAVSELLRTEEPSKRRKTKHKIDLSSKYSRDSDLASIASTTDGDPKTERKELHHPNTEKVSGVWYDTNRHLWRVVYMKGNKRKTQGFSSLKLGYEEARRKAIQMRHEMVALRHNDKI
ncbi:AP2 domain protein [Theileria parva strain Muguga]|uniref:AP2/ERF domain-containing protein n=1 Tax=Theileria parva TaxID=5875 RepID=Q4N177_THEPA|nr:AP2 domain protein [Theileria parva strain Muguga]EAN32226.1 AP2 domain protein [Theileria parva strain Muguga]|eukprot:XP_764509.1 hypothetical protein [Theileria parva strain Muguga]